MKLSEIAALVNGNVLGNGNIEITGVTNIGDAGASDITFAVSPHITAAALSNAAAVIISEDVVDFAKSAVQVSNPRVAFAKLLDLFTPKPNVVRGVHNTAVLGANVRLGINIAIMAHVVIAPDVVIGDNTIIYPHTYIGMGSVIDSDTLIYPSVTVRENCHIGSRVIIHSGTVIGSDGFGFVTVQQIHCKVPQVGNVVIEDDVELGANVTIDRATTGSTVVGRGTKIDNHVHLAHNVTIGENCLLAGQTGIAGSVKVGNNVTFAGQSGCAGHLTIGDNCLFAGRTGVISDVAPGSFYAGLPAKPHREWLRAEASLYKIPDLIKKIRELEKHFIKLDRVQ